MRERPKSGMNAETRIIVGMEHGIGFADDVMPAVFATPHLIGILEATARRAVEPCLESFERTVGTHIAVDHLAPTPLGMAVTCRAKVIFVQGEVITFACEAEDRSGVVAKGIHRRRVIDARRFAKRVARLAASVRNVTTENDPTRYG